jgi:nicotinate-nucleotide pyrophosphorylase
VTVYAIRVTIEVTIEKKRISMKKSEYAALMELISAKVEVMICDAFGRDSLHEVVRFNKIEDEFKAEFVEED